MGETIAVLDTVWNVGLGYLIIESKAKIVDKGEGYVNEVVNWQVRVVVLDGFPNQSSFITLVASDHR